MALETQSPLSQPSQVRPEPSEPPEPVGGPSRVVSLLVRLLRTLAAPALDLAWLWRRSIQARVVIGTLTLSAALAGARVLAVTIVHTTAPQPASAGDPRALGFSLHGVSVEFAQ